MGEFDSGQVRLRGVVKTVDGKAGQFKILRGIDLDVEEGEFLVITGRSGSGKSTLLNMITGIDRPSGGSVSVCGTDLHLMRESRTASWRGRTIGIVFQFFQLMPTLTVLENVMLPMDFRGTVPSDRRKSRALELLERTGVGPQAEKLPGLLSGGEQQRVAIARALANDPPILVADEPTGNLDSVTSAKILDFLGSLAAEGKTVILVTHERNPIPLAGRYVTLDDGRIAGIRVNSPVKEKGL